MSKYSSNSCWRPAWKKRAIFFFCNTPNQIPLKLSFEECSYIRIKFTATILEYNLYSKRKLKILHEMNQRIRAKVYFCNNTIFLRCWHKKTFQMFKNTWWFSKTWNSVWAILYGGRFLSNEMCDLQRKWRFRSLQNVAGSTSNDISRSARRKHWCW